MPGHKKPKQHDTLTFVNEEMTFDEVISIFRIYGVIKYVNKYLNRFFIQFETIEQAKKAQSQLGRIYRVAFAHAKSYPRPKKNFRPQGELIRLSHPADLPRTGGYSASRNFSDGMAMIEEYVKNAGRRNMSSASTQNEVARSNEVLRENGRAPENRRETFRGSENRREMAKSSKNQHQRSVNHNQHGTPSQRKPNSSEVQDPKNDNSDDSDDNIEKPEAQNPKDQKRPGEEREAEEGEYEEEEGEEGDDDHQDENEEEDQQAEARALGAGTRRRVRIEGLDEIMQELGSDMAYSVIVANIPERYTLDEVYDLVEEVKPIAFSEMDYSIKMRVKFCEVFLNDAADVDYLKQKLNDFVICGKQLTVMEPAEILDETRWNA